MQPDPDVPERLLTPWMRDRDRWVREATDEQLRLVIADIVSRAYLDEHDGDRSERAQSLEWLATRGERGYEWGKAGAVAEKLGLWAEDGGHAA